VQLELIGHAERQFEAIAFPVRLEQYLMVGAFNQVLAAKTSMPSPSFALFMAAIVETVRGNIAECAQVAYASLSLTVAQQLLMLESRDDLLAFIGHSHADWVVDGDLILFNPPVGAKSTELPSMRLISEALGYATELERIV
jgi:26S proteasome regulatory subunit N12